MCYNFAFIVTQWKPEKTSQHQCFLPFFLEPFFQFDMQYVYRVMQIINAAMCRNGDVDKCSPQTFQNAEPRVSGYPPSPQNIKISSELFRSGFHSSHRRLYFRSLARNLKRNFSKNQWTITTIFWSEWFWTDVYCTAQETVQLLADTSLGRSNSNRFLYLSTLTKS
jgi:hypothetical protein